MIKVKIQNIVATVDLKTKLPLEKLNRKLENTEYNPDQFPGLVFRLAPGKTALLFSSGRMVCTGAKTLEEVKKLVTLVRRSLAKIGIKTKKPQIMIQNIVSAGELNMPLNLTKIAYALEGAEYEPEVFPGLVYKMPGTKITFLLFGNGKVVCTGAKSEKEAKEVIAKLAKILKELR